METSAVVFGGGFVGGMIINADDDTRRKAIRMALDGRINWIDTAPIYGQGKSEEALGWLLEEVDEEPIISTASGDDAMMYLAFYSDQMNQHQIADFKK